MVCLPWQKEAWPWYDRNQGVRDVCRKIDFRNVSRLHVEAVQDLGSPFHQIAKVYS